MAERGLAASRSPSDADALGPVLHALNSPLPAKKAANKKRNTHKKRKYAPKERNATIEEHDAADQRQETPTTFPRFAQLPPELRAMICDFVSM